MLTTRVRLSTMMMALAGVSLSIATEPIRIAEGQGALAPKQPQACIGPDGSVHLVFGVGSAVHYCHSSDGGVTFEPAKMAFQVENMSLGMRRGPRVAVAERSIVVTAIGGRKGKGQDGDVLAWRSADNGETWKGPIRVNDVADSGREGLHAMAAGADGAVWCVWLDLRNKRTELFASKSTDGGATWSANTLVYRSPEKSICECCHPSIAVAKNGIHVLFRNSLAGNRDMYVTTSVDDGRSFSTAKRLGLEHWSLNACPMDGGMLAVDASGKISTVWRRAGELFCTLDSSAEVSLGRGEQAWIASTPRGPIAVWTEGRVGQLRIRLMADAESSILDHTARDAMIVSNKLGIIACWESVTDSNTQLKVKKIDAP